MDQLLVMVVVVLFDWCFMYAKAHAALLNAVQSQASASWPFGTWHVFSEALRTSSCCLPSEAHRQLSTS